MSYDDPLYDPEDDDLSDCPETPDGFTVWETPADDIWTAIERSN